MNLLERNPRLFELRMFVSSVLLQRETGGNLIEVLGPEQDPGDAERASDQEECEDVDDPHAWRPLVAHGQASFRFDANPEQLEAITTEHGVAPLPEQGPHLVFTVGLRRQVCKVPTIGAEAWSRR